MTRTPNFERKTAETRKWSRRVLVVLFFIALSLVSLPMLQSRAGMSGSDGIIPNGQAAVPTLVQHVATGMDRYPINTLTLQLPNQAGAGNCLILGVQFNSEGSVASVTDDKGNNWIAGPTTTNSNFSKRMNLYYVLNAAAGTQTIRVNFSGLGSTPGFPQAVVSEFYNVATSNAFDGSAASPTSRTAGTITTTAPGDLIYEWGASLSSSDENGGAFNGESITAGSGFTLLSADLQVGSSDQYQVQSGSGPITPTFSASGSEVWGSVAIALKSAPAGTAPGSGIRIVHLQHTLMQAVRAQGRSDPIVMQFPSSGNLLVGLYNAAGPLATNVTDSLGNNWSLPASAKIVDDAGVVSAQIVYAANASTSPNLSGITVSISATGMGDMMFNLYDITGAAASPFDLATTDQGDNNTAELTSGTITPRTTNGLVIHVNSIDFHQEHLMTSPAGGAFDTVTNDLESPDVSTLDMDNAYAHIYNSTTNEVNFTFTPCCSGAGVGPWAGVSAAFKGDGNASPTPTATPTPVVTPTPTGSPPPTVTPTPVVTPTPTGSPPPTVTPTPVTTPTPTGSPPPTVTPTPVTTPTPTGTPRPTVSPTPVVTPTPIGSPSPTVTPTPVVTPTPTGSPSPTVTPTPIATPTPGSQLGNISTRAFVQSGDKVMIGGFIVQGPQTNRVIVRAIGPELTQHGVPDAMSNPTLELHDATGTLIASNDNWQSTIIGGIITSDQRAEILASGHAPTDGRESAIIADVPPGNYTAIVRGVNDPTGVALAEVYDISGTTSSSLGNISTRSFVQTGDNVMIGGFIVQGTQPKRVILRAIGPELIQHRVPDALADPTLELHNAAGMLIASNDNWVQTIIGGIITTNQVSNIRNSGHAPTDPRESAIIATLPPGNYTAIVRGVNNTTGVGLVELYDLD